MSTNTEELVDTSLLESLDFEPTCESDGHNKGIYYTLRGNICVGYGWPTDTAEWIIQTICPGCGNVSVKLVCGGKIEQVSRPSVTHYACGDGCGNRFLAEDWSLTVLPIKGKP